MAIRAALALAILATSAAPVWAANSTGPAITIGPNDRTIACFRKVHVPAEYKVTKHLETPPQRYYVKKRNGIIELREKPAIYREEKKVLRAAHDVMQEVACPQ